MENHDIDIDNEALALGRAWIAALNARDIGAMSALLADDYSYWGMALTPPELGVRWGKGAFIAALQRGRGMAKPVVMTEARALGAGAQAVIEAEGHGVREDGGLYANNYCLIFEARDGQVTAVRDYCCTATAAAHFGSLSGVGGSLSGVSG